MPKNTKAFRTRDFAERDDYIETDEDRRKRVLKHAARVEDGHGIFETPPNNEPAFASR